VCGLFLILDEPMKNIVSLKNSKEFKNVYENGKSYANYYLVAYILENGTDITRLGISVSKKVGNSIVRHRLARLIRESYRLNKFNIKSGYDIVIIARASLKGKGFSDTEGAFLHLLKLHKILN